MSLWPEPPSCNTSRYSSTLNSSLSVMPSPARYWPNKLVSCLLSQRGLMSLSRPLRLSSRTESPATMNGEAERTLLTVAEEYDDLATDLESVAVEMRAP